MHCKVEPEEIQDIQKSRILQQTGFWARVKNRQGVQPRAFAYEASGDLLHPVGESHQLNHDDLLVLVRHLDSVHSIAYVPYGPKEEPEAENHGVFLEELSEELRRHLPAGCILIRYDLPWENQWARERDYFDSMGNWMGPPPARNQELRVNFNTRQWNLFKSQSDILPTNTYFINLACSGEYLLKSMKPKTRYNIRLSVRRGVSVGSYGMEMLDAWYSLYRETASRNGIYLHDIDYFRPVLQACDKDGSSPVRVKLLMAEHQGEFLAGMFLGLSGRCGTYLYGASSGRNRHLMATYSLQWEALRMAREHGCSEYDMFGTAPNANPSHPMHGLHRFKSGFGGKMFHRMGCWDYPLDHEKYAVFRARETNSQGYHVG
ncbi:MAG: peptidoglycan bridge formation glycyltransferase FemA/FemB family protein [Bacteroidales bacterium]